MKRRVVFFSSSRSRGNVSRAILGKRLGPMIPVFPKAYSRSISWASSARSPAMDRSGRAPHSRGRRSGGARPDCIAEQREKLRDKIGCPRAGPKGAGFDADRAQAVIEILPEKPGGDQASSGTCVATIKRNRDGNVARPPIEDKAILNDSQEPNLKRRRSVANSSSKDGPFVGPFEVALMSSRRW